MFLGRLSGRPSVVRSLTAISRDLISPYLDGEISMKPGIDIHHLSGHITEAVKKLLRYASEKQQQSLEK